MSRNKQKEQRRQERAEKRKERRREQRGPSSRGPSGPFGPPGRPSAAPAPKEHTVELHPPDLDRCRPPIYVDTTGAVIADPRRTLGLPDDRLPSEAEVRDAWRKRLIESPPEQDPEGSRRTREARDRLLDPARFLERELGVLHLPDPDRWGLAAPPAAPARLDATTRLAAESVLYALVEDALWTEVHAELIARPGRAR